jgi:hypothetical protein
VSSWLRWQTPISTNLEIHFGQTTRIPQTTTSGRLALTVTSKEIDPSSCYEHQDASANADSWVKTKINRLRRLLMQLFFRLNVQGIRNERHKEKAKRNTSSSPNTKAHPVSQEKGRGPAEPIEVDSIEVSSAAGSFAESSPRPNNEASASSQDKYTTVAFSAPSEDPSSTTTAGASSKRTSPPTSKSVADPYEVPTSQSSDPLNIVRNPAPLTWITPWVG